MRRPRPDSIIARFCSATARWRLLQQQNRHGAEVLTGRLCGPLSEGERTSRGHGKNGALDP